MPIIKNSDKGSPLTHAEMDGNWQELINVINAVAPLLNNGTLTPSQARELVSQLGTSLHYHSSDRERSNHTGLQQATTIIQDVNHRFVSDSEKSTWNAGINGLDFQGLWNAETNEPPLPLPAPENNGWFWKVSVPSNDRLIDGISVWAVNDDIISNGRAYGKIEPGGAPAFHGSQHLPTGVDPIPDATQTVSGLMSATDFQKLLSFVPTAIFVQDTRPADMTVNALWICTADKVYQPPSIASIFAQTVLLNTASDIPIYLNDQYDVNLVNLSVSSSNTDDFPINILTISGNGYVRNLHIAGKIGPCSSVITIEATNFGGIKSSISFNYTVVSLAYNITATDGLNGNITPKGTITVPQSASITFTGVPDPGYGVNTITIDGGTPLAIDEYTFSNVQAAHTIDMQFAAANTITASVSGGNGSVYPSGATGVVSGRDKTFTFTPDYGYQVDQVLIDGVGVAIGSTYTFSNVQSSHTIEVIYAIIPMLSQISGVGVSIIDNNTLRISWSDLVGESSYKIYYSVDPSDTTGSAIIARGNPALPGPDGTAPNTTHFDHTVTAGVTYFYTVVAYNALYSSTPSMVVSGNTNILPSATVIGGTAPTPRVLSLTPVSGAIAVSVSGTLTINFSTNMNSASMSANFKVYSDSSRTTEKVGTISQGASAAQWIFTPSTNYAAATKYYPCVKTGAISNIGVPILSQINWEFTTA